MASSPYQLVVLVVLWSAFVAPPALLPLICCIITLLEVGPVTLGRSGKTTIRFLRSKHLLAKNENKLVTAIRYNIG